MGTPGTLKKDTIGFSMPGHSPLFPRPPFDYQNASLLVFGYLTDATSAAQMLPAQATLPDVPGFPGLAAAGFVFAIYPASTLGPYLEVVQFLPCTYPDPSKPVQFATHLYVTTDVAMAAGREMGGYPKKIADISIEGNTSFTATLDRPSGQRLASATLTDLRDQKPVPPGESLLKYLCLRIIPSPTRDAPPSLSQLLLSDWTIAPGAQEWAANGTLEITSTSTLDALHFAPVVHLGPCKLIRGDLRVTANDPDPGRIQPF